MNRNLFNTLYYIEQICALFQLERNLSFIVMLCSLFLLTFTLAFSLSQVKYSQFFESCCIAWVPSVFSSPHLNTLLFYPFIRWHPEGIHYFKPGVALGCYLPHSGKCSSINSLKGTLFATISYCWYSLCIIGEIIKNKICQLRKITSTNYKKNKNSFIIEWALNQDCSACHWEPAREITKAETSSFFT